MCTHSIPAADPNNGTFGIWGGAKPFSPDGKVGLGKITMQVKGYPFPQITNGKSDGKNCIYP